MITLAPRPNRKRNWHAKASPVPLHADAETRRDMRRAWFRGLTLAQYRAMPNGARVPFPKSPQCQPKPL